MRRVFSAAAPVELWRDEPAAGVDRGRVAVSTGGSITCFFELARGGWDFRLIIDGFQIRAACRLSRGFFCARSRQAAIIPKIVNRNSSIVNHHRGSSPWRRAVCTGAALVRADCTMAAWRTPRETSSMSHFLPRGPRGFHATRVPSAIMRRMVMRL